MYECMVCMSQTLHWHTFEERIKV